VRVAAQVARVLDPALLLGLQPGLAGGIEGLACGGLALASSPSCFNRAGSLQIRVCTGDAGLAQAVLPAAAAGALAALPSVLACSVAAAGVVAWASPEGGVQAASRATQHRVMRGLMARVIRSLLRCMSIL